MALHAYRRNPHLDDGADAYVRAPSSAFFVKLSDEESGSAMEMRSNTCCAYCRRAACAQSE